MKKIVSVEQTFCDICGKSSIYGYSCDSCGKDFCYDHEKTEMVKYAHSLYATGHGDGHYCHKCDEMLYSRGDKLLLAYRKIVLLRAEQDGQYLRIKQQAKEAEERIMAIREERGIE